MHSTLHCSTLQSIPRESRELPALARCVRGTNGVFALLGSSSLRRAAAVRSCIGTVSIHYITLHYITLHYITLQLHRPERVGERQGDRDARDGRLSDRHARDGAPHAAPARLAGRRVTVV